MAPLIETAARAVTKRFTKIMAFPLLAADRLRTRRI